MAVDAGRLGSAVLELSTDQSKFDAGLQQAESKAVAFGKAAAFAVAGVGAAVAGIGVAAFEIGAQFDSAFDAIRIGTGATGENLEGLKADFRAVAGTVAGDFDTIATVIADLNTRTGQTGEGLQGLAGQIVNLSRITGEDAAEQVANVTRVFGDWGVATEDQAKTLDALFRASQATGIGMSDLERQVVQFGAPLRQMGFGFEESVGLLGKFEKEGVNAELVMGSLRIALGKMAKDGIPAREGLLKTMEAIKGAGDASKANALAIELFGARAGPDMAAAIREGRFELGDLLDTIENGSETIQSASDDTADLAERFQIFKNRVMIAIEPAATAVFNLAGEMFDRLAPAIEHVVAVVTPWIEQFAEQLPGAIDAVSGALSPLIDLVTALATGDLETVSDLLSNLLGIDVDLSGIVGPLAELATIAEDHLGGLKDAFDRLLKGDIIGAIEEFVGTTGDTRTRLTEVLAGWAAAFVEWVTPMLPMLVGELLNLVDRVLDIVIEQAPVIAERLAVWIDAFIAWAKVAGPPLLEQLGVVLEMILEWAMAQVPVLLELFLSEWLPAVLEWAVQALGELVPLLLDLLEGILTWIGDNGPTLLETFLAEWLPNAIIWVAQAAILIIPELAKLLFTIVDWLIFTGVPKLVEVAVKLGAAIIRGLLRGLEKLGTELANALMTAINSLDIHLGPFHLTPRGFTVDPPLLPGADPAALAQVIAGKAQFGADFVVPGSGAPDSTLLAMRVTPGERIMAIPPGRGGAGGRSLVVQGPLIAANIASDMDIEHVARRTAEILEEEWAETDDQGGTLPAGLVLR